MLFTLNNKSQSRRTCQLVKPTPQFADRVLSSSVSKTPKTRVRNTNHVAAEVVVAVVEVTNHAMTDPKPNAVAARVARSSLMTTSSQLYEK